MDTVEQLKGTYFYHGHANVDKVELFWLIFIECTADHTGLSVETVATMLSGQPLLTKPKVLGSKTGRTSVASKMARRIFKGKHFIDNAPKETYVRGVKRFSPKTGTVVGRMIPFIGYAQAAIVVMSVAAETRRKYNFITRPSDQIEWVNF